MSQIRLDKALATERDAVLLDPSILVSRSALAKLQRGAVEWAETHPRYLVPLSFVRLLNEQGPDAVNAPAWRYFAGYVAPASPETILSSLGRMQVSTYGAPSERPETLRRFSASHGLPRTVRNDTYVVSVIDEEASFLAAHSIILARVQKAFDALVKGGLVAVSGLENYLSREIIDRLKRYGWRRLCKNVAVPLAGVWGSSQLPTPWREILGSTVVFVRVDP